MLFLDGVYIGAGDGLRFRRVPPPTVAALETLVRVISERVGRALERQGLLVGTWRIAFWSWTRLTARASMIYWVIRLPTALRLVRSRAPSVYLTDGAGSRRSHRRQISAGSWVLVTRRGGERGTRT